jgi:peptidoglycan/LPS O-acetylase OafA/YrhL
MISFLPTSIPTFALDEGFEPSPPASRCYPVELAAAKASRIPGLDGLRAISIGLLLIYHALSSRVPAHTWINRGSFGVAVFFVLSGYLITWLLLSEEDHNGRLNLGNFYVRRAFRILPPALLFLFWVSILGYLGIVKLQAWDVLPCILFFRNMSAGAWVTAHFWSLAIEEQFYLLWPLTLLLIRRPQTRLGVVVLLVIAAPFWRQFNYFMAGGITHVNLLRFELKYDAILVGCGLALFRFGDARWLRSRLLQSGLTPLVCMGIIVFMLSTGGEIRILRAFSMSIAYLSVALIINYVIEHPERPSGRLLNQRGIVWVGMLSYSLYIWQQLAFTLFARIPVVLCLAFLLASLSYYEVEAPFLAFRRRWS